MTVVYLDTLFGLNALVDYLLLLAAARLAGEPLRRLRFLAGAVLGGVYAAGIFLPGGAFLSHPLCRLACAVLMLLLAYGGSSRLLRQILIFFALTCAFGGGIMAIGMLGGRGLSLGERGVLYSNMDLRIVLLSSALCYAVLTIVFPRIAQHSRFRGEIVELELCVEKRKTVLPALVDTGNTLSDPLTGRSVLVAEAEALADLFPEKYRPSRDDLRDPALAMEKYAGWTGRFRILPYRAVGVDRGLLLALRTDGIFQGGERLETEVAALSPTPVSDGGGYRALLGTRKG